MPRSLAQLFIFSIALFFSVFDGWSGSIALAQATSPVGVYVGTINRKQINSATPQPPRFYRFTFNSDLSSGTVAISQNGIFTNEIRVEGQMQGATKFVGKTAMTKAGDFGNYDPDDVILTFSTDASTVVWYQRDPKNMLEGTGTLARAIPASDTKTDIVIQPTKPVYCAEHNFNFSTLIFSIQPGDEQRFVGSDSDIQAILNQGLAYVQRYCSNGPRPLGSQALNLAIQWPGHGLGGLEANYDADSRRWVIVKNTFRDEILGARVRAAEQQQAAAKNQADAQARRALQEKFIRDFGVQSWANPQSLRANPFVYQNKIIGLRADFSQMISSDEAIFGAVIATGVPTSDFTSPAPMVLAIRVSGVRQTKTPVGGEIPMPIGSYVGVYRCQKADCWDFFDR